MGNTNLLTQKGNSLTITFQSEISLFSFEYLLKKAYSISKRKTFTNVTFNFSFINWFDVLQLSMTSLWIQELKGLGKEIDIKFPINQRLLTFLENYGFFDFLSTIKIAVTKPVSPLKFSLLNKPFLPLTFTSKLEYNKLLSDFSNNKYYSSLFAETEYYAVAKKGIIRDIVLKELGDNMFDHADGKFANMIVTRINNTPEFERSGQSSMDSIPNRPYIAVVISDKGPGIYKTLKNTYLKDEIESNKKIAPSETDIIEYSTFEHATSRSPENRFKDYESLLNAETSDVDSVSGLFMLKQTVKRFFGILIIKSGKSFVIFNYYQKKGTAVIYKSNSLKQFKNLANFGGTQIKVILPILEDYKEIEERQYGDFSITESKDQIRYKYISVFNYTVKEITKEKLFIKYKSLINDIIKFSSQQDVDSVILDMKVNSLSIDTKIKIILVHYLIKYQDIYEKRHVIINIDSNLLDLINETIDYKNEQIHRPIVAFNNKYQRDVIGMNAESRKLFLEIQKIKSFGENEIHLQAFANRFKLLFTFNKAHNSWYILHNRNNIFETVRNNLRDSLYNIIMANENRIFHQNIKVLAQNELYFSQYFEIYNLFENYIWRHQVKYWLEIQFILIKPAYILIINKFMYAAILELISETQSETLKQCTVLNLDSSDFHLRTDISELIKTKQQKPILIATDVISSGQTIESIIENIGGDLNVKIVSIVNLLEYENTATILTTFNKEKILEAVHYPSKGYESKPLDWNYSEIMSTNKLTHRVEWKREKIFQNSPFSLFESPLGEFAPKYNSQQKNGKKKQENLELFINPFFENIVIPHYAYSLKIISDTRYMPVFYNIPTIIKQTEEIIKNDITKCFEALHTLTKKWPSHLVTLGNESMYRPIINFIYEHFNNILIHPLSYNHLEITNTFPDFSGQGVVCIDDAFTTGENFFRIIEYCSNRNAEYVLVYILIKRSSNSLAERLKSIQQFGNMKVEFRYLFDGQIPVYTGINNPVLKSLHEYKSQLIKFSGFPISDFLKQRIESLQYQIREDNAILFQSTQYNTAEYLRIRWKLELAANDFGINKEFASLFEISENNKEAILLFFSILSTEKSVLFNREDFKTKFFYEKFKANVVTACKKLLTNRKENLSLNNIADSLEILYELDSQEFFDFIHHELPNLTDNQDIVYSLISILSFAPKDFKSLHAKFVLLRILDEINNAELKKNYEELRLFLKTIWKLEDVELSGYFARKLAFLKSLLTHSFHELKQKVINIETTLKDDYTMGILVFKNLLNSVNESANELNSLFVGDYFDDSHKVIRPLIKKLGEFLRNGFALLEQISHLPFNEGYKESIANSAVQIADCIFTEQGIISKLDTEFCIDLKQPIKAFLINFLEPKSIKVNFLPPSDSCLGFFTQNHFLDLISNVRVNIIRHSGAKNVKIVISKSKKSQSHFIHIKILDDGEKTEIISASHGIQKCKNLTHLYAGKYEISRLSEDSPFYKEGYRTLSQIDLHDLSPDILKLPTNDN